MSETASTPPTGEHSMGISLLRDGRYTEALRYLQANLQDLSTELTNVHEDPATIDLNDFRGKVLLTSEPISLSNGHNEDVNHHFHTTSVIFNRVFSYRIVNLKRPLSTASRDGQLAIEAAVTMFNMGLAFQLHSLKITANQSSLQKKAATFYQSLIQLLESFKAVDDNPLTILYLAAHVNLAGMCAATNDLTQLSQMSEGFLQAINRITDPGPYREEMEHLVVIAISLGFTNLFHAAAA